MNKIKSSIILIGVVILALTWNWHMMATGEIDLSLPNAVNAILHGKEAGDDFGTDLATGDLNNDGIDDLAIGARLAEGPGNTRPGAGEVYIFYGEPVTNWSPMDRAPDVIVYGAGENNYLGGDIGFGKGPGHIAFGDLDSDGISDLVLSAPAFGHGSTTSPSRGRVWIIWGRGDLSDEIDLAAPSPELEVTTVTAVERDYLGAALAVGDFDGDGIDDLAMSAPQANVGKGIVYVMFGGSHLRNRDIQLGAIPEDVSIFQVIGEVAGRFTGTSLGSYLTFGKLSDDSIDDLVIGSEFAGGFTGTVHVLFGGEHVRDMTWDLGIKSASWSANAEQPVDQLGKSLATGDINADDQVDLIMGALWADGPAGARTGQAIGVFGPLVQGQVRDLSITPGDLIIYGPQGGDDPASLGESIAIGDFNHDGVDDLLIGAREANGFDTRNESGIVYMFYGGPSLEGIRDLRVDSADITLVGAKARDFTGYVTAGDVTGDRFDDLITSATPDDGNGAVYILFGEALPPTLTPTATPVVTATSTPTVTLTLPPTTTPTPTATPNPQRTLYLPLILHNYIAAP